MMLETSHNEAVINQLLPQIFGIQGGPTDLDLAAETRPLDGAGLETEIDPDISVKEACAIAGCDKSVINGHVRTGKLRQRPGRAGQRMVLKSEILALTEHLTSIRQARGAKKAASASTPTIDHSLELCLSPCEERARGNGPIDAVSQVVAQSTETASGQMPPEPVATTPVPPSPDPSPSSVDCSPTPTVQKVSLATISFDEALQVRARIHKDVVIAYATLMRTGQQFPPVDLFSSETETFIGDGWHRLFAAKQIGYHTFPAHVHPGGRAAALRWALQANTTHGVRLTNADREKKVGIALEEYPRMSSNELSKICAVSEGLVRKLRPSFVKNEPDETRIGADGKRYPARRTSRNSSDSQGENPLFNKAVKLAERLALESLQRLQASIAALIEVKLKDCTVSGAGASFPITTALSSANEK